MNPSSDQVVLLVNLGSPDSPSVADVRRYLKEFLSDPRVMNAPAPVRQFVLHALILPRRPRNTAAAYRKIWTAEGSPLVVMTNRVQRLLQERVRLPVEVAMRYGRPSIPSVIRRIVAAQAKEVLLIPLYPHHAMSSYETAVERVREVLAELNFHGALRVLPPFCEDPDYLAALVAGSEKALKRGYDHLLFSFHGLPERHLRLADKSRSHCLVRWDCCEVAHPAHAVCYRAQVFKTVEGFVSKAGIPREKCSVAFQSRLGREPWLQPYTDLELKRLASQGIRCLTVICPSFVADCLETLEEIGIRGRELFLHAGGEELTLAPCMNDHPRWIETLAGYVRRLSGA